MELLLNKQEQQLLKNVLHALYKSFRRDPGMNIGTCKVVDVNSNDLQMLIDIHDHIVAAELAEEQDNDTDPIVREALDYIREQLDEDDLAIIKATVSKNLKGRCPASFGLGLDGKVIDLLEEYGEDNDLGEGWWEEYGDIDDVLMKL